MTEVRATLRLQFHRDFTLDDAVTLAPYFARLGISHIYASPLLKARPGSTHGYDVVDPNCINPELGGEAALERFVAALREQGLGLIVDFVPNHMAVGGDANPWWLDVLEWGVTSPYAHFFDIQWQSSDPLLKGQLLVPFLRTDYGEVLAAGEITLHFEADRGAFYCAHFDHRFPICPVTYSHILRRTDHPDLLALATRFDNLLKDPDYWHLAQDLRRELSQLAQKPEINAAIEAAIQCYDIAANTQAGNPIDTRQLNDDLRSNAAFNNLHQLLELQHYRVASWRTAADDINWRRFFDINDLGAMRVEKPDVFEAIHVKLFELVARGLVDGVRIDHIDGLANPRSYCRKLRRRLDSLRQQRPSELTTDPLPIYVEKILADGERLPDNWLVDGTTGYEFMNQISLLQHAPLGEFQLYDLWSRVSGRSASFLEEVREARAQLLTSSLAGDFEMVAQGLLQVARTDLATRDLTLGAIRRALFELIVHFPIYRTYAGACGRSEEGQIFFAEALADARTTLSETDWPLLEHIDQWLGRQPLRELPPGHLRSLRRQVLARFQQLTSPAAAKAVEDTACYRSAALLSRNDVGFDPQHFSAPLIQFHQQCAERRQRFPNTMLTTATHDHKRGEDSRARLAVISERAVWFSEKIEAWHTLASSLRSELDDGTAPSPGDEMILYQTLLGSWPLQLEAEDQADLQRYLERLLRWQEKALREAKLRSNWSTPNAEYEAVCRNFLTRLLTADDTFELRQDIVAAVKTIAPAGALNSLAQCLLRMTLPGLPDLYQGNDFWDFSLVDPDNRQPVDYHTRVAALAQPLSRDELLQQWHNGQIKQQLIAQTLAVRKTHWELFQVGHYQMLEVEGECADQVVAFARQLQHKTLIVIVPRLAASLLGDTPIPLIPPAAWGDTCVVLPDPLTASAQNSGKNAFQNLLFTDSREASDGPYPALHLEGRIAVAEALANFPVACLLSII